MWSILPRRTQLLIIVALGVIGSSLAAAAFRFFLSEQRPPLFFVAFAASFITLCIIPVVQWLWRPTWKFLPEMNRWFFPDLNGTWEGNAMPANPNGGEDPPRPVVVHIRQTLFDIHVSRKTDQLASRSTRALVERDQRTRQFRIWYQYEGRPPPHLDKHNPRHEGSASLEIDFDGPPNNLSGRYFTDRRTVGRLELTRKSPNIQHD